MAQLIMATPNAQAKRLNAFVAQTRFQGEVAAILQILGLFTVIYFIFHFLNFLVLYLRPSKLHRYLHHSADGKPPWSLITGASNGIGKALAYELALRGFNVVLHGRNAEKLAGVEGALKDEFPDREFRVLVADASHLPCTSCMRSNDAKAATSATTDTKPISIPAIIKSISDIHLTILINNAAAPPIPKHLPTEAYSQGMILAQTNLNANFPLLLTAALLPKLQAARPALILNFGSQGDLCPPLTNIYGPAKRMLMGMSLVMAREQDLQKTGVQVLGVRIGETAGTTGREWESSFFEPDADVMARAILGRVGCGRRIVVGYWRHAVLEAIFMALPNWLVEGFYAWYMPRVAKWSDSAMAKRQ
jgi:17beta-estradiol 17-dehydrogenase / very-long-chain 3-oxoacyl-CoA reductase